MSGVCSLHIIALLAGVLSFGVCDTGGHGLCAFVDTDASLEEGILSIGARREYVAETIASGEVLPDNKTMRCANKDYGCFTFWFKNNDTGQITILKQGCWIQLDACMNRNCVATGNIKKDLEDTRFCCCTGDYCNNNLTDNYLYIPQKSTEGPVIKAGPFIDPYYREKTIAFAIVPIAVLALLVLITFTVFRVWCRSDKDSPDSIHLMESTGISPSWELDSLKLNTLINRGRYGEVWQGTLNDMDVAVKVFTGSSQRQYYVNEKDIYMLPFMELETLPRFYGAEERVTVDGLSQYLLVMEYVTLGTLTNYLKHNSLDWAAMCKLGRTVASGLAYLHVDISKQDKIKPVIAHRDLNTRNILVRPDNICVICDFGFAMQLNGTNYTKGGTQEVAENSSLSDVGTIRYMAPEVLEGAVNLRDCEASLRQIDVYALGLVFWEIGTRCADLYQGLPVPEYQLPFQAELGPHPSFDDMQIMVSKNKGRPLFPDIWKDTNLAIRAFKETIEDCWDQDGEARLTAMCVEERVQEMETLWSVRHKVGVTPTINTTNFQTTAPPVPEKKPELCNTNIVNENEIAPNQTLDRTVEEHNARNLENMTSRLPTMTTIYVPPHSRYSISENSSLSTATTDTLLSPLEPMRPPPNVQQPPPWSMYITRPKVLQPHQGKNPIVERNTHKRSDEDLEIQGNTIIKPGCNPPFTDGFLESKSSSSDTPFLMQNDHLNSQETTTSVSRQPNRSAPRIPFMQNDVASEPLIVQPKLPNVQQTGNRGGESKSFLEKLLKGPRLSRLSFLTKNPVKNKAHMNSDCPGGVPSGDKAASAATSADIQQQHHHSNLALVESKFNGPPAVLVGTEVCLQNGHPVTRSSLGADNRVISALQQQKQQQQQQQQQQQGEDSDCDSDVTEPKKYMNNSNNQCIESAVAAEKVNNNDSKHNLHRPEADADFDKTHKSLNLGQLKSHSNVDLSPPMTNNRAKRPSSLVINNSNLTGSKPVVNNRGRNYNNNIGGAANNAVVGVAGNGSSVTITRHLSSPELMNADHGDDRTGLMTADNSKC